MATIKESAESRADLFSVLPTFVRIPGVDFEVKRGDEGFDERTKHLQEDHEAVVSLVKSILRTRWIAPFDVKRRGDGEYVNINGRFRTFATRIVNEILSGDRKAYVKRHGIETVTGELIAVPVRVLSDKTIVGDRLIEISIAENTHFDDPPITLAHKFDRLRMEHGWTVERIAEASRVTPQSVRNTLALLKLDADIAEGVNDGTYPVTVGYELAKLPINGENGQLATIAALKAEAKGGKVRKASAQVAVGNAIRALPSGQPEVVDADFEPGSPGATAAPVAPVAPAANTPKGKGKPGPKPASSPNTKYVPPGLRDFKALLRGLEEGTLTEDSLDENVWKVLRWAAGDLPATRIAGLSQALKIMGRSE